jgi:hypothetical protein
MTDLIRSLDVAFLQPESAFFASNTDWRGDPPYPISGDMMFRMGGVYQTVRYVPLPWSVFFNGWEKLAELGAVEFGEHDFFESYDRDNSINPFPHSKFYICGGVLVRYHNDSNNYGGDMFPACMMRGKESDILSLCKGMDYPDPKDRKNFPFKSQFELNFEGSGNVWILGK